MLQDVFNSIKGNFKQKTTNPFFGTLILIWICNNWIIIYAIFNFDQGYTLENKINFINDHITNEEPLWNLMKLICFSFIVLIFSYFLINLSRLIINLYEKKVTPWIYKISDKNDIVLKSVYEELLSENYKLREKYESERAQRIKAENETERLESEIHNINNPNSLVEDSAREQKRIEFDKFETIAKNLSDIKMLGIFGKIIENIGNGKPFSQNENLNYLVTIGLVKKLEDLRDGNILYSFTPDGDKFKEYYVDKYILQRGLKIAP